MSVLLPPWARDEEDVTVDDPSIIQLACWATGVYTDDWHSGQVPDEVWEIQSAGLVAEVTSRINHGASWTEAFEAVRGRL